MAHPLSLPTAGLLALLGAGAGIHLGRSAIAEINPIDFGREADSSFYAELTPHHNLDSAPRALSESDDIALGSGCVGCRTYPEEYHPVHDPAVDLSGRLDSSSSTQAPVQLSAYQQEAAEDLARRKADLQRVELYARAPVSMEEMAGMEAEPLAPPSAESTE